MLCHGGKRGPKRELNSGTLRWVAQPRGSSVGQGRDRREVMGDGQG